MGNRLKLVDSNGLSRTTRERTTDASHVLIELIALCLHVLESVSAVFVDN